jgi:hypothetical protein
MSAPRDPKSLRSLIALTLLACFSKGSHGPTAEVVGQIEATGYNGNTPKVQVSQVRLSLLGQIGVELPFVVKGKMTADQKTQLDRLLSRKFNIDKSKALLKDYRKSLAAA